MNQIDAMKSARLLIEGTAFTLHTLPSGQACICSQCDFVRGKVAVLNDLRQAIEQAEKAEPVAWLVCFDGRIGGARVTDKLVIWRKEQAEQQVRAELIQSVEPLYTRIKS